MDRPTLAGILHARQHLPPEPCSVAHPGAGLAGDRRLPHRRARRRTRALRKLRRRAPCLAFVSQPPLPAVPDAGQEAWRAARLREVLPVPYAHWVFTLPHALNPLAIRHPRWLYGALFDSAAATLLELAANPRWLGAVPGFSLVLHLEPGPAHAPACTP